jgi:hypothetical protein
MVEVIIADREDNLQRVVHKLNQITTEYGLTISVQKTKSMAFRGRDPVRTKIVIDNKIIEQVNSFNYLENMISYEKELDIDKKLHNYLKITDYKTNAKIAKELKITPILDKLLEYKRNWIQHVNRMPRNR